MRARVGGIAMIERYVLGLEEIETTITDIACPRLIAT